MTTAYDIRDDGRFSAMMTAAQLAARTRKIKNIASEHAGTIHPDAAGAARILAAVQRGIEYRPDGPEDWQGPLRAVRSGLGDCDDSAVVAAALFFARGWPVRLVAYGRGPQPTHVVAQVFVDGEWRWAETTLEGARLGEEPWDALRRLRAREAPPAPVPLGAMPDARHEAARDIVTQAFTAQLGRAPTRFERQLVQGVGLTETSYGRGWGATCGGACVNSNNWGAVQATGSQPSCPCSDSHQDGTRYSQGFRVYASDLEGARDLVRHMTTLRPMTAAALARGASVHDVARAMYLEKYFGASCPNAIKKYGAGTHRQSSMYTKGGATTEAGKACDDEAIGMYAKKLASNVATIADALGEPAPAATGSGAGAVAPLVVVAGLVGAGWWAFKRGWI